MKHLPIRLVIAAMLLVQVVGCTPQSKNAQTFKKRTPEIEVTVDSVTFLEERPFPPETPHVIAYELSIHNRSSAPIRAIGRTWTLTHHDGRQETIQGEGLLGEKPQIEPGEKFTYTSFHLIKDHATARGQIWIVRADGQTNGIPIPDFELKVTLPAAP